MIAAYFVIRANLAAHTARVATEFSPFAPISIFTLRPNDAIMFGVILTILFFAHWIGSGLFGKAGISKALMSNIMLIGALCSAMMLLFEQGAHDFYEFSLFCDPTEPLYLEFDISFQCERSRWVGNMLWLLAIILPILAIPVRIMESRRAFRAS
jgi:hypothetical protein